MANQKHAKVRKDNTSGHKGVSFDKRCGEWRAQIWVSGSSIHLGYFEDAQSASDAYKSAVKELFGEDEGKPPFDPVEYRRTYNAEHKDQKAVYNQTYRRKHLETLRANDRQNKRKLRLETFAAYGGKCVCCGESVMEFLTIDHVNGGGNQHRKIKGSGANFYRWLKKAGFPQDEYRLLCYNCNCARGHFGYCPHDRT